MWVRIMYNENEAPIVICVCSVLAALHLEKAMIDSPSTPHIPFQETGLPPLPSLEVFDSSELCRVSNMNMRMKRARSRMTTPLIQQAR